MPGNNPDLVYEITDTINLQYQPGGSRIYKARVMIDQIACERAEDGSLLIFGEYSFFLLLKINTKKNDYGIKVIKCPFIKPINVKEAIKPMIKNCPDIPVTLFSVPEYTLENMDAKPSTECRLYRLSLSYKVELQPPVKTDSPGLTLKDEIYQTETSDSLDNNGSVKVWRVEPGGNHTVEQLLGIDRDTLKRFSKEGK